MSDPLATTTQHLASANMAAHPLRVMSEAEIRSSLGKSEKDLIKVAGSLQKAKLDLVLRKGILWPRYYCADAEVLKKMDGKKEVLLSSSTESVQLRHAAPRLLKTLQEMHDRVPAICGQFPVSRSGLSKAALSKVMAGGGAHLTLQRLTTYGPKVGWKPEAAFTAGEVVPSLLACGRRVADPERVPVAIREVDVKVNLDADNGFPVGGSMRDPFAQERVLQLAGGIRKAMLSGRVPVKQAVAVLKRDNPEYITLKGKAKTDVYAVDKVRGNMLRFYNVVPKHLVILIQSASQPLSDAWKAESRENWTTGIGKGFAMGRADELVRWLDKRLETESIAWSHTGDDTLVVRRWTEAGQLWCEIFSLDCSSFDLTQHADTTEMVHLLMGRQMIAVDEVAGELWHSLMRERTVTIAGSLPVTTRHWGASGMPLQSEVNDTLMECFLRRLSKRDWFGKEQLGLVIAEEGAKVGFQVRLEDYFKSTYNASQDPVRELLKKRPFLYLGYYLYEDKQTGSIAACLDINRFFAGGAYLNGGFVEKSQVGAKVALALGGYALSFGVPPPFFEEAWDLLRERAIQALDAVGSQLADGEVEAEVGRHVYAGLPSITDVKGLIAVLKQDPRIIWLGGFEGVVERPLGDWADEPWVKEATGLFDLRDPKMNELAPADARTAGRPPPTPTRVLDERAARAASRQAAQEERTGRKGRRKRLGRLEEEEVASTEEFEDAEDYDEEPEESDVASLARTEWTEFHDEDAGGRDRRRPSRGADSFLYEVD